MWASLMRPRSAACFFSLLVAFLGASLCRADKKVIRDLNTLSCFQLAHRFVFETSTGEATKDAGGGTSFAGGTAEITVEFPAENKDYWVVFYFEGDIEWDGIVSHETPCYKKWQIANGTSRAYALIEWQSTLSSFLDPDSFFKIKEGDELQSGRVSKRKTIYFKTRQPRWFFVSLINVRPSQCEMGLTCQGQYCSTYVVVAAATGPFLVRPVCVPCASRGGRVCCCC